MNTAKAPTPRLGARTWWAIIVVALAGQVAWAIENMYLNVFVYRTISTNPAVIATLVAASAICATLTTLLVGAWSDRLGKRRVFIAGGYLIWGFTTASFGLVGAGTSSGASVAPTAAFMTGAVAAIIALDCVMSIFGAGAHDAAFSAWVTDSTVPENRGRTDGVIAIFPLVAMLLVFGALDPLTQEGKWQTFFLVVGLTTSAVGVLAWFLVEDRPIPKRSGNVLRALASELRIHAMRAKPVLFITLGLLAVIGIATQVFMPYLIIYVQMYLKIDDYPLLLAVVLVSASVLSVLGGRLMDKIGKDTYMNPAIAVFAAGLVAMAFARGMWIVAAAGTVMMAGMLACLSAVTAMLRDATPVDRAGTIQGLRMIASVAIPMVVGPVIGAIVITGSGQTYEELGQIQPVPGPEIFLAGAIALLAMIPLVMLRRKHARHPIPSTQH